MTSLIFVKVFSIQWFGIPEIHRAADTSNETSAIFPRSTWLQTVPLEWTLGLNGLELSLALQRCSVHSVRDQL